MEVQMTEIMTTKAESPGYPPELQLTMDKLAQQGCPYVVQDWRRWDDSHWVLEIAWDRKLSRALSNEKAHWVLVWRVDDPKGSVPKSISIVPEPKGAPETIVHDLIEFANRVLEQESETACRSCLKYVRSVLCGVEARLGDLREESVHLRLSLESIAETSDEKTRDRIEMALQPCDPWLTGVVPQNADVCADMAERV
jgi:hypothetical protein